MKSVRHTSRALKLRTDASVRFERGLDPNLVELAMGRALSCSWTCVPAFRFPALAMSIPNP